MAPVAGAIFFLPKFDARPRKDAVSVKVRSRSGPEVKIWERSRNEKAPSGDGWGLDVSNVKV